MPRRIPHQTVILREAAQYIADHLKETWSTPIQHQLRGTSPWPTMAHSPGLDMNIAMARNKLMVQATAPIPIPDPDSGLVLCHLPYDVSLQQLISFVVSRVGQPLYSIIEQLFQLPVTAIPTDQFFAMLLLVSIIAGTLVHAGQSFLQCTRDVQSQVSNNNWEQYSLELRARSDSLALEMSNWTFSTEVLECTWSSLPHEKLD